MAELYGGTWPYIAKYFGEGIAAGLEEERTAKAADRRAMESFRRLRPLREEQQAEQLLYESKAGEQRLARESRFKQEAEAREQEGWLRAVAPFLGEALGLPPEMPLDPRRQMEEPPPFEPYAVPPGTPVGALKELMGIAKEKLPARARARAAAQAKTPTSPFTGALSEVMGEYYGERPPTPEENVKARDIMRGYEKEIAGARLGGREEYGPTREQRMQFAREYETAPQTRAFVVARDAYARVESVGQMATPAGDIALIFGFMKILDPTSVVREGEFATAANAGSIPTRIWNMYNKALSGTRLTSEQRADFQQAAARTFESHVKTQREFEEAIHSTGKGFGIGPGDVPDVIGRYRINRPASSKPVRPGWLEQ